MPRTGYLGVSPDSAKAGKNHGRREAAGRLQPRPRNRELRPLDFQSTEYLELEGALGALRDVLVEALLGIVRQLEGDLGGAAGPRHQQQQREQPAAPTARGGRPALRGPRPRHPEATAAASTELRGDAGSGGRRLAARGRPRPGRPAKTHGRVAPSLGEIREEERAAGCRRALRRDRGLAPGTTYRAEIRPVRHRRKRPEMAGSRASAWKEGAGPEAPAPATRMCSPRAEAERRWSVYVEARETSASGPPAPEARGGAIVLNVAGRGQREGCVPPVSRWGVPPAGITSTALLQRSHLYDEDSTALPTALLQGFSTCREYLTFWYSKHSISFC